MELILANFSGKLQWTTLNGRDYVVAPLVLIVPGVLNGSSGPFFYPPDEAVKNADAWNGMPMVVYHPTQNGKPVSARNPAVLTKSKIGRIYNAEVTLDGQLHAKGWFDVELVKKVDNRVWTDLSTGRNIELSTGLQVERIPKTGEHNGKSFTHEVRNWRPDHVAILPDQTGACSIQDGCGVLVNFDPTVHASQQMSVDEAILILADMQPLTIGDLNYASDS